ncbi:MAG: hypothetical protein H6Q99_3371 [Proteobacteria bacterium]|nr:hypothetical protein [Pseudomonadota bacterium]
MIIKIIIYLHLSRKGLVARCWGWDLAIPNRVSAFLCWEITA